MEEKTMLKKMFVEDIEARIWNYDWNIDGWIGWDMTQILQGGEMV